MSFILPNGGAWRCDSVAHKVEYTLKRWRVGEVETWPADRQARKSARLTMYFVYIIKSKHTNFVYKGFTRDINKRLVEHELGQNTSTKGRAPFDLIHVEICNDRLEARKLEKFYKSGWGREIIGEIINERQL